MTDAHRDPAAPVTSFTEERPCCSVCDLKKRCSICREATLFACSDCRIDFGVSVYVCSAQTCRDAHEQKCSLQLRQRLTEAEQARIALTKDLAECYRQSGADPDGNEDWRLAREAVEEVTQLRKNFDETETAMRHAEDDNTTLRAALRQLQQKIEALPRRVEPLGGQQTSYVQLDNVLALLSTSEGPETT